MPPIYTQFKELSRWRLNSRKRNPQTEPHFRRPILFKNSPWTQKTNFAKFPFKTKLWKSTIIWNQQSFQPLIKNFFNTTFSTRVQDIHKIRILPRKQIFFKLYHKSKNQIPPTTKTFSISIFIFKQVQFQHYIPYLFTPIQSKQQPRIAWRRKTTSINSSK